MRILLSLQSILIFTALLVTSGKMDLTGGGINLSVDPFLYVKIVFLLGPYLWFAVLLTHKTTSVLDTFKENLYRLRFIGLFGLAALLSLVFAVSPSYSALKLAIFIYALGAVTCQIGLYHVVYEQRASRFIARDILYVMLASLALPIACVLHSGPTLFFHDIRSCLNALPLTSHANALASFYAYGLFHVWFFSYRKGGLVWLLRVVLPILVLLLFSRSVIGAMILSSIITLFLFSWWYRSVPAFFIWLIGVFSLICVAFLIHANIVPFQSILSGVARWDDAADLYTLTGRTEVWTALLNEITLKTLSLGHGFAVMREEFVVDMGSGFLYGAHNTYLAVLMGTGMIGLLGYSIFLVDTGRQIYRHRMVNPRIRTAKYVLIMFQLVIHGMTSSEFGQNLSAPFALVLFVLIGEFRRRTDVRA